jgi:hypothetical protein
VNSPTARRNGEFSTVFSPDRSLAEHSFARHASACADGYKIGRLLQLVVRSDAEGASVRSIRRAAACPAAKTLRAPSHGGRGDVPVILCAGTPHERDVLIARSPGGAS